MSKVGARSILFLLRGVKKPKVLLVKNPMYLSLYRKYRSQKFEDILGQSHITQTLQNALRTGRVTHAYLFCGPRGTGKTTTARVLAKALNCEKGPTPDPCDQCPACIRIREGHSLDVVEIDAASNRGIDEIRALREQVGLAPVEERYKLYIIDEVHMLTTEAFNALLKTLEEPPQRVVFVLATTEAHKVPRTIISRCQRFDFRRGGPQEVLNRLEYVARQEGFVYEPSALQAIVNASAGSFRDALALLEQVHAYSPEKLTLKAVQEVLGSVETPSLLELSQGLLDHQPGKVLSILHRLIGEGKEPRQLLVNFAEHLRNLLAVKIGSAEVVPLAPELALEFHHQAQQFQLEELLSYLETVVKAEGLLRWISDHRLLLELTLVRLAQDKISGKTAKGVPHPLPEEEAKPVSLSPKELVEATSSVSLAPSKDSHPPGEPQEEKVQTLERSEQEKITLPSEAPAEGPSLTDLWNRLLQRISLRSLKVLLQDCQPVRLRPHQLEVRPRYDWQKSALERPNHRKILQQSLETVLGAGYKLKVLEPEAKGEEIPAKEENSLEPQREEVPASEEPEGDPFDPASLGPDAELLELAQIFDGEIIKKKPFQES